jgi:hypothetical protein
MKRVLYGPFTIVIITITVGSVNVNDRIQSFTIVVSIDLGGAVPVTYAKDDIRLEAEYTFAGEQFRIRLNVKKQIVFIHF